MRILAVTNMYPSADRPAHGVFVAEQVKGLQEIGLDVHVHFVDRLKEGMKAYRSMLEPIRKVVREQNPDILHLMYGGVMADRVTRHINQVPQVVTFHGSDLLGENLSGWVRKGISHYGVWCSRRAARRAHGVVVVSERLKKALPTALPRVRVIPCGIDLKRFRPLDRKECQKRLGWDQATLHVLFPSHRQNTVKRPQLARMVIEELTRMGITTQLHFLENVANESVPVWMNASDALLLTSAHEGSPTVVKEALGCGLPIVSVDVGDVAERIAGVEGCYVTSEQPVDLASKLKLVLQAKRRISGSEKLARLDLVSTAKELESFYKTIADL